MSPKLKVEGTGTLTEYNFRATGPVKAGKGTEPNDDARGHEASGKILDGAEVYEFSGVPTDFDADHPWELDLSLDMGTGWVETIPPFLNAATVEVTGEGCHYLISVAEPGMIIHVGKADARDDVLTDPNTVAAGNVKGGTDSWRVWPFTMVNIVADHPAQARFANPETEWVDVPVYSPEMDF